MLSDSDLWCLSRALACKGIGDGEALLAVLEGESERDRSALFGEELPSGLVFG